MDGQTFWPKVGDPQAVLHDRVFFGYGISARFATATGSTSRTGAATTAARAPALFDLENDPKEENNVIAAHPKVVTEMRGLIEDRFEATLPAVLEGSEDSAG